MTLRLLAAILIFGALPRGAAHRPTAPVLAIVVSRASALSNISLSDLRRIYLGDMTRWADGRRIVPVVLPPASVEQSFFLNRALQMADIDYAQHWIGQIFRGRVAGPPHTASSSASARRFVAANPDAIAFIDAAEADTTVRVLTVNGKRAGGPDYPLAP
jgi:ABC-type phosphate transport system substrate-binding protein